MDFLYHSIIGTALLAASPFILLRMAADPAFRRDVAHRLEGPAQAPVQPGCLWIHAASAGEVRAAQTLINIMKQLPSPRPLVLSTFTRTGYDLARKETGVSVFRLPPDFSWWIHPLVAKLNPAALVLIEAELWPCLLRQCLRREVPVVLVNGRLSERSFRRYSRVKPLFHWITAAVRFFSMRSQTDAGRLIELGISGDRVRVTGNLKFDALPGESSWDPDADTARPVAVFGSTRPGDEEPVLDAIVRLREDLPGLQCVLAPRHLQRLPEVERMIRARGLDFRFHSRLEEGGDPPLILVDRMGELTGYYAQCRVAFVGGGFRREFGGQNILEPAAFHRPVVFGPHMQNFAEEADGLVDCGGGIRLQGPKDLYPALRRLLTDPEERRKRGQAAGAMIRKNRGAAQRNLEIITSLLNPVP